MVGRLPELLAGGRARVARLRERACAYRSARQRRPRVAGETDAKLIVRARTDPDAVGELRSSSPWGASAPLVSARLRGRRARGRAGRGARSVAEGDVPGT